MLTIDSVHVGDLVTSTWYSPVYNDPPVKLRVTAVQKRKRHSGDSRLTTMVQVDRLDPDTDEVVPAQLDDDTYTETGRWFVPRDLSDYDTVWARWDQVNARRRAYEAARDKLAEAAVSRGLVLTDMGQITGGLRVSLTFDQAQILTDLLAGAE